MAKRKPVRKDPAVWDRLVDLAFEVDAQHPYLSQTVEGRPPRPPRKTRAVPRKRRNA